MNKQFLASTLVGTMLTFSTQLISQNVLPTSGNVGIGTTSPETNLDVKGCSKLDTVYIRETFTVDKATTLRDSVTIQKTLKIEENIEVLGDANFYSDFRLKTLQEAGSPLRMVVIDSTGKLEDLNKRGFLEYLYQIENCVVDENGDYYPPVWNNKPGVLYTTPILGCPPHKVGIGTSNPIAQLDVKENVAIGFDDVTPILKYPNTYPVNYKLAVNGKIISTGLKIENVVNWSDFVFDSVYVLQPLKSVEDYLLEYKHLPNIPSAKEVEENGYEVQEMDALLLEKIEQLFLYVIELEKQNTILQQKVAELEGN